MASLKSALSHAIVIAFDLEITAWPGSLARQWSGPGETMEIVQIGATKLDVRAGLAEIASFDDLVRPKINPELSDYFVSLTGITQSDVDSKGANFVDALDRFVEFIGDDTGAVLSTGSDGYVLEVNCGLNGIPFPYPPSLFHNIARDLAKTLGCERVQSSDLPSLLGFPPPGRAHQAYTDAQCIAGALQVLRRQNRI